MLTRLRTHFGTAGLIVAIVALIAALGGAAIAAGGSDGKATASAKGKPGPRGKTGKTGKPGPAGPAGPAGPQGPAGANGKDGANGANGANGSNGATGATGKNGTAGIPGELGATGPTGSTGATGPTGSYGGVPLAPNVTETGYWAFNVPGTKTIKDGDGNMVTIGSSKVWVPISFPDPIINSGFVVRVEDDPDFEETCGEGPNGAGGSIGEPKAPRETLCIFNWGGAQNETFKTVAAFPNGLDGSRAIGSNGAIMEFETVAEGPARAAGTWAVTG